MSCAGESVIRSTRAQAPNSAPPRDAERLAPWLAGAVFVGGVQAAVALSGVEPSAGQRAALILALCGSVAVAGVVAARSTREVAVADHQERERPAAYEIAHGRDDEPSRYLENMERWVESMFELIDHAASSPAAIQHGAYAELRSAGDDTSELRDLLNANRGLPLKVSGIATLRSICSIWEAEQAHIEPLAARMDREWYRRWRARSVVERLVRHGSAPTPMPPLPYRV